MSYTPATGRMQTPVATECKMQGAEGEPDEVVAAREAAGNLSPAFDMMADYMQDNNLEYEQHIRLGAMRD